MDRDIESILKRGSDKISELDKIKKEILNYVISKSVDFKSDFIDELFVDHNNHDGFIIVYDDINFSVKEICKIIDNHGFINIDFLHFYCAF